ncbi:hypothetical protein [Shewanella algae]|uniref:hypothetical protein n=1 Tax=Shewanella algae TaxID=38313 RepID=UPI0031F5B89F
MTLLIASVEMSSRSSTVQYAYALDRTGILTHICDAQHSNSYTCPGCKRPLIPVLGETNAKHFRHFEECCALETYLHKCAKEAFYLRYQQALSTETAISLELEREVSCYGARLGLLGSATARCSKTKSARYNLTQFFNCAELEKRDDVTGLQPDVMLIGSSGNKRCYIEICVTHPCSEEKIATGVPILEFKVESEADIQMLLTGQYFIKDERLNVFNWQPPSQTVDHCVGPCSAGNVEMSVWSLSDSGRLNERVMPLDQVDLLTSSTLNTWPRSLEPVEVADRLKTFLRHAEPSSRLPNCLLCAHSMQWDSGFIQCRSKGKQVAYTEARQCAKYQVAV